MPAIRVWVAHPDEAFRKRLGKRLQKAGCEVVGSAGSLDETLAGAEGLDVAVYVVAERLGDGEVSDLLSLESAAADAILVLLESGPDLVPALLMQASICGSSIALVPHSAGQESLSMALDALRANHSFVHACCNGGVFEGALPRLSRREHQVLQLIALGDSYREAGDAIGVSTETVKSHMRSLLGKMQVPNRTALAARAVGIGLVKPPEASLDVPTALAIAAEEHREGA